MNERKKKLEKKNINNKLKYKKFEKANKQTKLKKKVKSRKNT